MRFVLVLCRIVVVVGWSEQVLYRGGMVLIDFAFADIAKAGRFALLRTSSVAQSRPHASLRSHPSVTSLLRRPAFASLGASKQRRRFAFAVVA